MRTIYLLLLGVFLSFTSIVAQAQSISPTTVTLKPSQTQLFTIQNPGMNHYNWYLNPPEGEGTVVGMPQYTASGQYTAPSTITAPLTITVYASCPGHPVLSATIKLAPLVGITVSPTWISLTNSQSAPFTASITGASNTAVTWSSPAVGSMTSGGVYTAPSNLTTSQNITVTAKSLADPTKSATATIALVPTVSITLSPTSASLTGGQSISLSGVVSGTTNTGITWSLSPQAGTLSNGVYTAPSPIPSAETVTVTATSQASTGTKATAVLSLITVSVAVTPSAASLTSGQSARITATVSGSSNTGVNWSVTPAVGTVTSGVYQAPASVTTAQIVTVTAASVVDSTKKASTAISLVPSASVSTSMTPTSASLTGGQSTTLKATVSGSSNTAVNWTMSPSVGTLSGGVYTAPATVASAQTVTVKATSAADPTKSASAAISLVPVSIAVSPTAATVMGGQSATLRATISGSSNSGVNWSMSPSVGTLSGGVYTAPVTIASAQTVTVKAASAADSTKTASATISLTPVAITVSPTAASLSGGQSTTLRATISGSSNTAVNWSMSPSVGTLSNGVYTAPATISSAQTITVTATSAADGTKAANATISLVAAAQTVAISVTPSSASLTSGQSSTFAATVTGTSNLGVNWTLAPSVGTLVNGVYSAPASISTQQTITVAANSAADPTKVATAMVTLTPAISIAVVPATATLSGGQTAQFSASLTGTSNPNVTWSLSPAVGTVSNGLYQAPATINSQQTITVTAASSADLAKTASATITLVPAVGVALTPSSTSLTGGQSTQFSASINGTPSTAVTWTLAPSVGTITNGVYTAPVTIFALQTIILTVASTANPSQTATATITLNTGSAAGVSPSVANLGPSGTQQFTATGLGTNPKWTITPSTGSITAAGLYSAPSSFTTQTTVTVTATNATDATQAASATVTLSPAAAQSATTTGIVLPVEVMGPNGTTAAVSFSIPSGTNPNGLKLWLQIHGLRYETQASLQVNGGAWQPISDTTVTMLGLASTFGGIGGGFHTFTMTLPVSLNSGTNTVTFRFNATDGVSSGFRVINFNVLDTNQNQLIPQSSFTLDDPSQWQPPLNTPADIAAGQTLWKTANLTVPDLGAINAKCADCHTQDGRDLKYFNYSNYSIHSRAVFHGLTAQQGDQIASYIRSLNTLASATARPWNPPYQPGPGTDSKPVAEWAAGAGLDAVLDNDADTLQYVLPGGSTANLAWNANLNQRETPVMLQFLDWNSWLPTVHPMDAFGATFTNSPLASGYLRVRSELTPNDPTSYKLHHTDLITWLSNQKTLLREVEPASANDPRWNNATLGRQIYSIGQWEMVKLWEINQEYGLEAMTQAAFGSRAESRAWYSNQAFQSSPEFLGIHSPNPGIGNGSEIALTYSIFFWYDLQLILNDGNGTAQGTWPIDRGYAMAYIYNNLTWDSAHSVPRVGTAGLYMEWFAKVLQSVDPGDASPYYISVATAQLSTFSQVSPAQKIELMDDWVSLWLADVTQYTPAGLLAVANGANPGVYSSVSPGTFTGDISHSLPILKFEGVDINLLNQIVTWAAGIWPAHNWAADLNQSCSVHNLGEVKCP